MFYAVFQLDNCKRNLWLDFDTFRWNQNIQVIQRQGCSKITCLLGKYLRCSLHTSNMPKKPMHNGNMNKRFRESSIKLPSVMWGELWTRNGYFLCYEHTDRHTYHYIVVRVHIPPRPLKGKWGIGWGVNAIKYKVLIHIRKISLDQIEIREHFVRAWIL